MTEVVLAVTGFVIMEPVAAGAHRLVMHGKGWGWHRSHHVGRHDRIERNDCYPAIFACLTVVTMSSAAALGWRDLFAALTGVSCYGMAYLVVHDVCVHGRLSGGRPILKGRWLRWVASCHAVHHRTGGAPFGFLLPFAPRHRALKLVA